MKMLKTVKDKLNNDLELWISDQLVNSPCVPLYTQTGEELLKKSWAIYLEPPDGLRVAWVQDSTKKVLGGIAYRLKPEIKCGWGVLSFTDPEYRGRGINQLCHEGWEIDCKSLGCIRLGSTTNLNNKSRLTSAEKVGMKPNWFILGKKI